MRETGIRRAAKQIAVEVLELTRVLREIEDFLDRLRGEIVRVEEEHEILAGEVAQREFGIAFRLRMMVGVCGEFRCRFPNHFSRHF